MKKTRALRVVLVLVMAVGALGAAGPGTTIAYFEDTHDGAGSFSADVGYSTNPGNGGGNGNDAAFNDANGNGVQDEGEESYNPNQLRDFNDSDANLVIPADVEEISHKNKQISITAGSIDSAVNISSENADVVLEATSGDVNLEDTALTSLNNRITISAAGTINVDGGNLTAPNNAITFDASKISGDDAIFYSSNNRIELVSSGTISVDHANLSAPNNEIVLNGSSISARQTDFINQNNRIQVSAQRNGGGAMDATGANFETQNGNIDLRSVGHMTLDSSTLYSQNNGVTADLGTNSSTLSVDQTTIDDSDATLVFDPDGISVIGSANNQTSP